MRTHRWVGIICLSVALCLSVVLSSVQAQEKVIKLKFAHFLPAPHKISLLSEQWCKEVEKRTNGRVKVTYHPGGTIVPANQAFEAVTRGIVDISVGTPSWTAGRFPLSEVTELPLGFKNAVQATGLANAFNRKFKPKEYDPFKVLFIWGAGTGSFMTLKPVNSIEGLKGLKIRAGGAQAKIVSAMGATAVSVPMADIYEGLQRGVIDGIAFYPSELKGYKFGDMIRGYQENPAVAWTGNSVYVMSKKKWDSLPEDIRKIIDQINDEWILKVGQTFQEMGQEGLDYGVSKGMKVFKVSPQEQKMSAEKVKPILDAYVKDVEAKGLPGREALKFCQDYLKAH